MNTGINMSVSKSPNRHTFHADAYIKRCKDEDKEVREDYLEIYKFARQHEDDQIADPKWQKDNMEYDLRTTDWILEKVRASKAYAQNLYAAICNNDFQKLSVIPILTDKKWSASWRSAGGIIANMRQEGDYIDWYCSGIRDEIEHDPSLDISYLNKFVAEMIVTDEIREDLKRLGWIVVD